MESPLKRARIEAGYSLEEVAKNINIRKQYLVALEEGRYSDLPGKVYAQGYFKIYANYLNLPIDSNNKLKNDKVHMNQKPDLKSNNSHFFLLILAISSLFLLKIIYKGFIY